MTLQSFNFAFSIISLLYALVRLDLYIDVFRSGFYGGDQESFSRIGINNLVRSSQQGSRA